MSTTQFEEIIINANFINKLDFEVTKCKEPRWGLCKYIKEGSTFSFKGESFNVNSDMTCTVNNVIYATACRGCRDYYIGETNNLRNRTILHNQHILERKNNAYMFGLVFYVKIEICW